LAAAGGTGSNALIQRHQVCDSVVMGRGQNGV